MQMPRDHAAPMVLHLESIFITVHRVLLDCCTRLPCLLEQMHAMLLSIVCRTKSARSSQTAIGSRLQSSIDTRAKKPQKKWKSTQGQKRGGEEGTTALEQTMPVQNGRGVTDMEVNVSCIV